MPRVLHGLELYGHLRASLKLKGNLHPPTCTRPSTYTTASTCIKAATYTIPSSARAT
jgi:hypothetical protein